MMRVAMAVIAIAALSVQPARAASAGFGEMVMVSGEDRLNWTAAPASLPRGIRISILSGDPARPGPFTLRLKIPAGTVIAPHTHATAETVTVLAGGIVHETGETRAPGAGSSIGAGGFVFLPAQMPHSLWTNASAAEIQVNGTGPFGLHYINPADDPSRPN